MYLPTTRCVICSEQIYAIKYNLKTTHSEKSKQLLIELVKNLYKNIFILHCNICVNCHDLLNELDSIQQREKELNNKLKSYISKFEEMKMSDLAIKSEKFKPDDDEECLKYEDVKIDVKGLPIKVKRINGNSKPHHRLIEQFKNEENLETDNNNRKAAFQMIQSSIQLDLTKHVEDHLIKSKRYKDFLCEICGQHFRTRHGYENHLKKHDNIEDERKLLNLNKSQNESFFCDICGKNFTQKSGLGRHYNIHTGETRYQCDLCGKKFLHHSSFNLHQKIHAGIRNFECDVCKHTFLTNAHLKRHKRSTHDKVRNHICTICSKKFTENYNLTAHIKIMHKNENIHNNEYNDDDDDEHEENNIVIEDIDQNNLIYRAKNDDDDEIIQQQVLLLDNL